jgi:hypothetical protein
LPLILSQVAVLKIAKRRCDYRKCHFQARCEDNNRVRQASTALGRGTLGRALRREGMSDEPNTGPGSEDDATEGPFARLAALRAELHETVGSETVDGSMAARLLEAGDVLERVHAAALELQQGAEGFDNTGNARLYAGIQDRLAAAAGEIASSCEVLVREHKITLLYTHVPKDDVLARLTHNHACLEAARAALSDVEIVEERTVGQRSVLDVVAEVVAREQRALERLRRAARGERPGADTLAFDRSVEAVRVLPPALLHVAMRTSFEQVVAAVEALSDEEFGPTGAVVRALGNSVHMTLAYDTYGFYADRCRDLEAVARTRR